jgi:hypothetical protein
MEKKLYLAPEVELFEVEVEQGFAQSGVPNGTPQFTPFGDEQPW